MSISIARKTLLHEWRRFLPATIAIAFSGVLMSVQGALLLGIVGANSLYVTQSTATYWVGFPGTQSVDLGRTIPASVATDLYAQPAISHVEPILFGSGDWRGTIGGGGVSVTVLGIDTSGDAEALARIVPNQLRNALSEPSTVVVDIADASKLSTKKGGVAEVNGRSVRIVGYIDGLRGLGGVNVVASLETARQLDQSLPSNGGATYFLYDVKPGMSGSTVQEQLNSFSDVRRFEVWSAEELASMTTMYMLLDSGAGIAFIFATLIAVMIGAVITSQTLMAAVAGTVPQYATLRALGVPFDRLRIIVIEQAGWVALFGFVISLILSVAIAIIASIYRVPFELRFSIVAAASTVVLLVAAVACLLAIHRLRDTDPATLLR
ncbi:FtsX-like permease family protein [Rhizobium sp. AQ_MP]|uniref:ABC transporter permease n=1 Tax=Rhizobium sp. AQ_MP TaxID=2761536 RepID=UPI001639AAD4|nr:ABC transporter permease [Rhizobium sp. AQ_MP]MBC2775124.1 FtsX-like permease family protein [Rhizobium sp. AQ_MP]